MTSRTAEVESAPATWGAPHQRVITWFDPDDTAAVSSRSGFEFLRAVRDGVLPPPPMAAVFGLRIVEVAEGRVVFECTPDASTYNPLGLVHGGLVSTLADTVCGCAVHTSLPQGASYTTIELTIRFLRPVTLASGTLRATGTVRKPGRRVAFADATIVDGTGREVASASSSLLVTLPDGP